MNFVNYIGLGGLLTSTIVGVLLSGCTHFQGPGEFKTGADYETKPVEQEEDRAPNSHEENIAIRWPVNNVRITQRYRPISNPKHKGIDLGGYRGMPIYSAHSGKIIYAGRAFRGYGNMVLVEFDETWASLYAHLQKIKVRTGQMITPGTLVGTMGKTGRATGVHLHFELIHKKEPIDPLAYLTARETLAFHKK